jgi:pimeloyl-ACP methyl ester carboxylesterase
VYAFLEDEIQYDMFEGLPSYTKPKLFIAGSKDTTVPMTSIQKGFDISAEPKELQVLDSGHNYRWHAELIEKVNVLIEKFLKKIER